MADVGNLGLGCVSLTQHPFMYNAQKLLSAAFHKGIKHFDTAPLYGNGYSEKILGKFIKNKRSEVTITTKCGLGNLKQPSISISLALSLNAIKKKLKKQIVYKDISQPEPIGFRSISLDYVIRSLNNSLKNLKTDYIDYYLLHEALPSFLTPEALSYLLKQKKQGVIKELGIAASYVNLNMDANDLNGFDVLQYENGPHYKTDDLLVKFKEKTHFYHSALKSLQFINSSYSKSELAGILLSRESRMNPSGKILFSTTNINRLNENIQFFEQFNKIPLNELNSIYSALH